MSWPSRTEAPINWYIPLASKKIRHPDWGAFFYLAAAATIVIATAAVVVGSTATAAIVAGCQAIATVVAAAAEQQDQNDDPPAAIPTETIVTHNEYLRIDLSSFAAHSKIFRNRKSVQPLQFRFAV